MIKINGTTYNGSSVSIINNRVIIDGVERTPDGKVITIEVTGDLKDLKVDYAQQITINGKVDRVNVTSGDVTCGDVNDSVTTVSGDVEANNIGGDVQTVSGDVKADTINGDVETMSGDIKYKK